MKGGTTQFTTQSKNTRKPERHAARKYKMRWGLVEPTIGLEPMTCRLRIDCSTN